MRIDRRLRFAAGATLLGLAMAAALWMPIPTLPDAGRASVVQALETRLPGWRVERVDPSWEGAYAVVTRCAGKQLAFQLVPGHGLRPQDAWLQPSNAFSRDRLRAVSDHWHYLVWFGGQDRFGGLPCRNAVARQGLQAD